MKVHRKSRKTRRERIGRGTTTTTSSKPQFESEEELVEEENNYESTMRASIL